VRRYAAAESLRATALAVSPDGARVFVTGPSAGGSAYATLAYDAITGAKIWVRRYEGSGSTNLANGLVVSPDGARVYVTGTSFRSASDYDYATIAYESATGARIWGVRHYNGPANLGDVATAVGLSPDGSRVYVTGYSGNAGGRYSDYATVAYNAVTGAKVWVRRYVGTTNRGMALALAVSPDGARVFVTGKSYGIGSNSDYVTVAYGTGSA